VRKRPLQPAGEFGWLFACLIVASEESCVGFDISRPSPTIHEMEESALQFCELSVSELGQHHDKHAYTTNAQLPHRCTEALYIVTLLRDVFAIDPTHRRITFALDVSVLVSPLLLLVLRFVSWLIKYMLTQINGHEVDWTLGYALAEAFNIPQHAVAESEPEPEPELEREQDKGVREMSSNDRSQSSGTQETTSNHQSKEETDSNTGVEHVEQNTQARPAAKSAANGPSKVAFAVSTLRIQG
jgi:hypothetical protein